MSEQTRECESSRGMHIPWTILAPLMISAAGVLVAWGATSTQVSTLKEGQEQQRTDFRALADRVATDDKDIAVNKAQYAEIIRRLDVLDRKLDGSEELPERTREGRP
jgi:hypothetical protein